MFVQFNKKIEENKYSNYATSHTSLMQQHRKRNRIEENIGEDDVSTNSDYNDYLYCQPSRLYGGARHKHDAHKLILSPSQCKLQPAGLKYFDPKNQVNVINLQLNDVRAQANADDLKLSQRRSNIIKHRTRATQTLYRESSAQTLPYLPAVSNNATELEDLEIFHLPTILPGIGPPGLYEVEVLERARKRWKFAKALKENFRKQLEAAKGEAKLQQHEHILEAFEWEHWIEREENIQECQMLRLELLIRMFDKRERDMHMASRSRIQKSYDDIKAKKDAALKKNEIEHNRAMRRLEIKHKKQPRVWRKEHITKELGDPSSEFNAPKMRYGVNPNRRHYIISRRGFDMRMDNLEKKVIHMDPKNLKCPFAKLKQWSKPKEILQEVEQNFCSDANLSRLYDSLRSLRETSKAQKYKPLCLKIKHPAVKENLEEITELPPAQVPAVTSNDEYTSEVSELSLSENISQINSSEHFGLNTSFEELRQQKQTERLNMEKLQKEMRCEELEILISSYQGNTIGWLMRFLTEEMHRLKEQRRLQFLTMLATRKRWQRESAEAGLRQKETCMRETYEKMYKDCNEINKETTQKFLDSILRTDIEDYARQKAEQDILVIAKELDKEISAWLQSFGEVQNPLNYQTLRQALKDIVMPDEEKILYRLERDECIDYIINDVLLNKVYKEMESYDISHSLTNDLVDRLIDNDLYLNSSDCSSDYDNSQAQEEAKAIIRKVIRRAVPGRRWLTEEERIAEENIRDLLDNVFNKVIKDKGIIEIDIDIESKPRTSCGGAFTDLTGDNEAFDMNAQFEIPHLAEWQDKVKLKHFNPESRICAEDITKSLRWNEKLLLTDPDKFLNNEYELKTAEYVLPEAKPKLSILHNIPSYYDLSTIESFRSLPTIAQASSEDSLEKKNLDHGEEEEDQNVKKISLFGEENEELKNEQQSTEYQEEQDYQEVQEVETERNVFQVFNEEEIRISVSLEDTAEEEDDDTSGVMRFSFNYDPERNFSVAIPTNDDDDRADI